MHLGIACFVLVLGRGRGINDAGVHDGAAGHLQALAVQVAADFFKQPPAQVMLLQQVAKLAHGGLIGHALAPQIDAHEAAHRQRVVERFFHRRVR